MVQSEEAPGSQRGNEAAYDPKKDLKRKAKSKDPGWKYRFWPNINRKDVVQCMLCDKQVHAGIGRLNRHLAGGFTNVEKCAKTTTAIMREMNAYLSSTTRRKVVEIDSEDEAEARQGAADDNEVIEVEEEEVGQGVAQKRKRAIFKVSAPPQKVSKSVASMLRKSPEEVIEERHAKSSAQTTIDHCIKKSKEDKEPLLERAKKKTDALRDKHELAWQEYGCTLMSDGWTDKRSRHLVNFLVNSPARTFFLDSHDVSSKIIDARFLAKLLEDKINEIGSQYVVQVVTDNGANYKAARKF
ncbi:uncharacterized protein LOC133905698 [Phragmites australis]|uniref:uncharacterized protein LOC133905698 n=1 Tax=Phragmites australis TaxID=29695 RepID=UPI002D7960DA|nr:uncharacterized protein LOC133905698 [Phragmites australis]